MAESQDVFALPAPQFPQESVQGPEESLLIWKRLLLVNPDNESPTERAALWDPGPSPETSLPEVFATPPV